MIPFRIDFGLEVVFGAILHVEQVPVDDIVQVEQVSESVLVQVEQVEDISVLPVIVELSQTEVEVTELILFKKTNCLC